MRPRHLAALAAAAATTVSLLTPAAAFADQQQPTPPGGEVVRVATGVANATVLGNVTVVAPTGAGHVRAYPCTDDAGLPRAGAYRPNASVANFGAGQNVAAFIVARTDAAGDLCLYSPTATHLLFDTAGVVPAGAAADTTRADAVARTVYTAFVNAGATPQSAAGVVAVLNRESGMDPNLYAGQTPFAQTNPRPNVSGPFPPGVGLAQLADRDRIAAMLVAADRSGRAWDDPVFQADYLASTLASNYPDLVATMNYGDADDAAAAFARVFLRAELPPSGNLTFPPGTRTPAQWHARLAADGVASVLPTQVPTRVLDTRTALSPDVPRPAGSVTRFPAPAGKVTYGTITAVNPQGSGHLAVWDCATTRPVVSTVNFTPGQTTANTFAAKASTGGQLCVYTSSPTHLVADVAGTGPGITATTPLRRLDTRTKNAPVRPAGSVTVIQTGVKGRTVVGNLTAVGAGGGGHLTAYPCDTPRPAVSSLNYTAGAARANFVMARTAANGTLCVYTSAPTHILFDQTGRSETVLATTGKRVLDTRSGAGVAAANTLELKPSGDDWITGGEYFYHDGTTHTFSTTSNWRADIDIRAADPWSDQPYWAAIIQAPDGQELAEGVTYKVERFSTEDRAGLDIFGNGRGCNDSSGDMTVHQWQTGPDGVVTRADVSFTNGCTGQAPYSGRLQYNSSYRAPVARPYVIDGDDYLLPRPVPVLPG